MTLTVATGQFVSVAGDVDANVATAVRAVGAARGARVLVLPELFLCGYTPPALAIDSTDTRLAPLDAAATAAGMVVLAGAALRASATRPTISIVAFGHGVRAVYDKQHLCGEEQQHFAVGRDGAIIDVDGWKLGLAICYDGCFPEHARTMADAGTDLYVAPMAYYTGGEHRRDVYYRARALDNGMFVATSGLVGDCGGAAFNGGSAVYEPEGRIVAQVPDGEEGVALAVLDHALIGTTRSAHAMHTEHRDGLGIVRHVTTG